MDTWVVQYKKTLKRQLSCSGSIKKQLLDKFDTSLSALLEDSPSPSKDELHLAFGPPKEMATILMEEVSPQEIARCRKRKIITCIVLGVVVIALLAYVTAVAIALHEYNNHPITTSDDIIVENDETTANDSNTDDIIVEDEITVED